MILEIDLNVCKAFDLRIEVYALLLLLHKKQFEKIRDLFPNEDRLAVILQELQDRKYIALSQYGYKGSLGDYKIIYIPSPSINNFDKMFNELLDIYPKSVIRPDGIEASLHSKISQCKELYKKATKLNKDIHENIVNSLKFQLEITKMKPGGLTYMKSLYRWLEDETWRDFEEGAKKRENNILNKTDLFVEEIGDGEYGGRLL